jgi:hypothetical protein
MNVWQCGNPCCMACHGQQVTACQSCASPVIHVRRLVDPVGRSGVGLGALLGEAQANIERQRGPR